MDQNSKKRKVAESVLDLIENGEILGIGSGSTVNILIEYLPKVKNKIQDICRHVMIGLVLTFLLALSIIYMVNFNNEIIVIYTFVSAILLTLCYFYFEIYKY